jgi:diketogulonate reductase-like aldo/keto reductase
MSRALNLKPMSIDLDNNKAALWHLLGRLQGVQCVAFSPLGGGGIWSPAAQLLANPVVVKVATQAGKSPAQV